MNNYGSQEATLISSTSFSCSLCPLCWNNNDECDEADEATTKKLPEWKIVAKAVRDKKATHAANSFNCLFYTTLPRHQEREQEARIEVSRRWFCLDQEEEKVRYVCWRILQQAITIERENWEGDIALHAW